MAEIFVIIAPVFLLMILGFLLGKTSLFPKNASESLIAFVWYVAIPALLFRSLAPKDLPSPEELVFVAAYYGSLYIIYAGAVLFTRRFLQLNNAEQGVFALTTCFVNGGFIGIPVLQGVYGDEGVRLLLVLLSFHSLTLIPVTTYIVERAKLQDSDEKKSKLISTIKSAAKSPILIALISGLSWSALGLPFPDWLNRVLELPANAASPVGLFAVGIALSNVKIAGNLSHAFLSMGLKLLALPVLVFSVAHFLLGLPPIWVGVATLMAALPSGMVGYSFATQCGVGQRRAATAVLLSTVLSSATLSLIVYLLLANGFA